MGGEPTANKMEVYERILRILYYVVFSRYSNELRVFRNVASRYQELASVESRIWMPELELGLGLWQGRYEDIEGLWLRWYDAAHNWIPTPAERAEQESQRVTELEAMLARYRESFGELPE